MVEFEGFVKMKQAEFEEAKGKLVYYPGDAPYKTGALCWYDGKIYIAVQDTSCSPTTPGHWKLVIVED